MLMGPKTMPLTKAVDSSTATARVEVLGFDSTAREWDVETGMYFYRARYYSPTLARFIAEDPIRFAAGDVNFYRYVGNNPGNFTDPMGLFVGMFPDSSGTTYQEMLSDAYNIAFHDASWHAKQADIARRIAEYWDDRAEMSEESAQFCRSIPPTDGGLVDLIFLIGDFSFSFDAWRQSSRANDYWRSYDAHVNYTPRVYVTGDFFGGIW